MHSFGREPPIIRERGVLVWERPGRVGCSANRATYHGARHTVPGTNAARSSEPRSPSQDVPHLVGEGRDVEGLGQEEGPHIVQQLLDGVVAGIA